MVYALLALGLAASIPVPACAAHAVAVSVGMPDGFDDLAGAQQAVVDVYFGGRRIGQSDVQFQPSQLTFTDVDAVVAMLPDILDQAAVRAALATAPLDTHAELNCTSGADRETCGRLQPAVAGIIFDQDHFRLEVFVNPRFLKVRSVTDDMFLPRPNAGLSLVDSIAGTLAGGSGSDLFYTFQNRAVLGDQDARIIATTFASGSGLKTDVLTAQLDKPDRRYTAGTFWARGIDLIGRRKVLGAGIETQFDTRSDKSLISGSPIVVSLSQRSRVDILVSGRLMASRTYEAGNQSVDTSSLPDGAYEVVVHIQELGGASRDERRFFAKNPRIAPVGTSQWFVHGGVLVDDTDNAFLSPTRSPYLEAGTARRLGNHVALDTTMVMTANRAIGEIAGDLITARAQIRLAALVSTRRDYGLSFQAYSTASSSMMFNFDVRRVFSRDDKPLVSTGNEEGVTVADIADGYQEAQFPAGTFTQAIGEVGYRLKRAQLGFSMFYRRDAGRSANYAVGPTARWSAYHSGGLDLTLEANISQSNAGRSAFAGLRLQLLRPRSSFGATSGAQTVSSSTDGRRSSLVQGVQGAWQGEDVLGGDMMIAGNYDHTPDGDLAHARADMRGPSGTIAADVVRQIGGSGNTQYSLGFQTAAIVNRDVIAFGGKEESDSVVAVSVRDAAPGATFQVFIDDTPRGIVNNGDTLPIAVTPYRQYHVRIQPIGGGLVHFETASRRVSVYPGNVATLSWTVKPVVAMFGRMSWPDGTPVGNAEIVATDAIGHTDPQGYFQLEAGQNADIVIKAIDGRSCRATLSGREGLAGFVALGTVRCHEEQVSNLPAVVAK